MKSFDLTAFAPPLRVPTLASAPLVLRPFAPTDLGMVRRASEDPLIPSITSVPRAYTEEAGLAFIERQHERAAAGDGFSFVIAEEAAPGSGIGSIGLWLQEIESGRASVGYWLVGGARGRGMAAHALRAVVAFAFEELAIPRLHLFVEPWNVASARTASRRASATRPRCEAGSASTASSAMPTASPSCARSGCAGGRARPAVIRADAASTGLVPPAAMADHEGHGSGRSGGPRTRRDRRCWCWWRSTAGWPPSP